MKRKLINKKGELPHNAPSQMPLDPSYYYQKGTNLFWVHGKYEEAVKCFDKATEGNPNYIDAHYQKARVLGTYLKNNKAALEPLNQVLKIDNNHLKAYELKGFTLINLNCYETAIKCFDEVIRISSENNVYISFNPLLDFVNPAVYTNKAFALSCLGKWEEAIVCYDRSIKLNPKDSRNYFGKGQVLLALGEYNEAIKYFNAAIKIEPKNVLFYYPKAFALAKLEDGISTITIFDKIVKEFPDYAAKTNYEKGRAMYILKDYQAAIDHFNQALNSTYDPSLKYQTYKEKGGILYCLGENQKALDNFEAAIKINPYSFDAHYYKGMVLFALKNYREAINSYDTAIIINPYNPEIYNNKAQALLVIRDHKEAIICCDVTIKINPNMATAYYTKGVALRALKNYDAAIECFDQAIKINPEYLQAYEGKLQVSMDQQKDLAYLQGKEGTDTQDKIKVTNVTKPIELVEQLNIKTQNENLPKPDEHTKPLYVEKNDLFNNDLFNEDPFNTAITGEDDNVIWV